MSLKPETKDALVNKLIELIELFKEGDEYEELTEEAQRFGCDDAETYIQSIIEDMENGENVSGGVCFAQAETWLMGTGEFDE